MILDDPIQKSQFFIGQPVYYAVSPPEGRRFVTKFPNLIIHERIAVSKIDAIVIALDKCWIIVKAILHVDGKLWLKVKFKQIALKNERVYQAVISLMELLETLYKCIVSFEVIDATGNIDSTTTRRLGFTKLQLFHYYNTN